MPRLFRVILPVTDIEAAKRFYGLVLGIPGQRVSPGRHYFDCGGTVLACYDPVADGDGLQEGWKHHPRQYVYFAVSDLDATHQQAMDAGGTIVEGRHPEDAVGRTHVLGERPIRQPNQLRR